MIKNLIMLIGCIVLPWLLNGCTYLKYATVQAEYAQLQDADPSQVNLKHMLDRETFFVYGQTIDESNLYTDTSMAIAAYSSKFKQNERVDTMFFTGTGTHYGLNLPEGHYTFLVYADSNNDQRFEPTEVVGKKHITLSTTTIPDKIKSRVDIPLTPPLHITWANLIPRPKTLTLKQSLFYPTGTIRQLSDPLFNEEIATLGMYDPASFLEHAPTMFYALEEDLGYKIPVVFVHGIGGSARSFAPIVEQLDKKHYRPWFFYYPSGGDLHQLADFFYQLFLSGDVIPLGEMPLVIVAHSMGGLVVREAFNQYQGSENENKVSLFVSIATPFGGHPSAALGEKHGLIVLPAWRDLNPNNKFIKTLYRNPLPDFMQHQLIYAYNNTSTVKLGDNSDGVVPLHSQLYPLAQQQSSAQFGFNSGHTNILENQEMIKYLLNKISNVKNIYPAPQLKRLTAGGFNVTLSDKYSPTTQYLIKSVGEYLVCLAKGIIEPINPDQARFVQAVQGKTISTNALENEFILFMNEYPDIVAAVN